MTSDAGAGAVAHAADIISTVEFDHTGDYLATGDKGGRVVLFERNNQVSREFGVPICRFACTRTRHAVATLAI